MHTYVWLCSHSFYRFPGNNDCYKVFKQKKKNRVLRVFRGQELCERRDGRSELPIPNSPYSLCGRKSALKKKSILFRAKEPCESRGGRPGLHVPNSLYGLCGPKAAAKKKYIHIKSNCHSAGTHTPATPTLPLPL